MSDKPSPEVQLIDELYYKLINNIISFDEACELANSSKLIEDVIIKYRDKALDVI